MPDRSVLLARLQEAVTAMRASWESQHTLEQAMGFGDGPPPDDVENAIFDTIVDIANRGGRVTVAQLDELLDEVGA